MQEKKDKGKIKLTKLYSAETWYVVRHIPHDVMPSDTKIELGHCYAKHIMKNEIVRVLIVVLFGNIANMAMMHFLSFDPFWVTFGSIVGLTCCSIFRHLKKRYP